MILKKLNVQKKFLNQLTWDFKLSIQDRILTALDPFKRKLYNSKLSFSGNEHRVIRLQVDEDMYGDESLTLINHEEIIVNMKGLEDIPLNRLRKDLAVPQITSQQSLYLFDILPIIIEPKLNVDLEVGDIIIRKLYDENLDNKPFYLVLRITEALGSFSPLSLVKLQYQTSPYIQKFDQEIIDLIEGY